MVKILYEIFLFNNKLGRLQLRITFIYEIVPDMFSVRQSYNELKGV